MKQSLRTAMLAVILGSMGGTPLLASLKLGATAPDFTLPGVDGSFHELTELSGKKATVVVFTCNHCPFAQAYQDRIMAIQKTYGDRGLRVVAVNANDTREYPEDDFAHMQTRSREKGYNVPYLRDRTQLAAAAYGAEVTPHVFLFDGAKKLRYEGGIDDNWQDPEAVQSRYLALAIEALLDGKPVPVATTNPRGCSIKWANPGRPQLTLYSPAPLAAAISPLSVGSKLPNALVADLDGSAVWLRDTVSGKKTVLVVFRGGWCPYCTRQLAGLQTVADKLKQRGYQIVAISPDTPTGIHKGTDALDLGFTLLSDVTMEAIMAMGLAFTLDAVTVDKYKEHNISLRSPPGCTDRVLPVPAVVLVDESGNVTYVYSNTDYRNRLDPQELLKAAE